ncbi:hypothetical protein JOQ06_010369 [Pogonophryne albipinna]|uniref:Uncharacterized protein n=1 Tax=Pogonophryne albipinna TaxID=1090488 RepID=A0AAD6AVQ8_9TELE|nr:hypothetical protein JOQ06_010369 [Pogonophryne albipinna]
MLGLDVCEFGGQVLELLWLTMCYRVVINEAMRSHKTDPQQKVMSSLGGELKGLPRQPYFDPDWVWCVCSISEHCILADKKDLYIEEEEDDRNLGYTAPVQKSLEEIQALDKDDENPSVQNVQVTKLTLLCDEAPRPLTMDLTVDKQTYMAGSFGPKEEEQEFITPVDEAANGVMNRGHYQVKSCLKDDDKNVHLSWEWSLEINKDWIE